MSTVAGTGSFVTDLRQVLRGRDFRRLFATRLSSQASDGAFQVALASLFFFSPERAATAGAAAVAFAVALLPYTLVGPFAGVLLDRWSRRQILVWANVARAGLVLAVAALVAQGSVGPLLYVVVLTCLSVNRFFLAGLGASLPHVVERSRLVMANAVSPTCGTLAALLGGAGALVVRALLGAGAGTDALVLLIAAAGYLGSAALTTRMHPTLLGPDVEPGVSAGTAARGVLVGLVAGGRHLRERRPAAYALAAIGAHRLAYGLSTISVILLCRNYLTDPDDVDSGLALLSAVLGASGTGFAVAALVTPPAVRRWGAPGWVVLCFAGAAAVEAVFVLSLSVPLLLGGAFALGVAAQGSKITVDAIVQASVDDAYRGRVFSIYDLVFNAAFVAAAALAALTVPADGYSPALYAVIAALYAATSLTYGLATRSASPPATPQRGEDSGWRDHHAPSSASADSRSSGPRSIRSSSRWR